MSTTKIITRAIYFIVLITARIKSPNIDKNHMIKPLFVLLAVSLVNCNFSSKFRNRQTKLLTGKWKVVAASLLPFEHISFCKKLNLAASFEFNKNAQVKVFETDTSKQSCVTYQTFSADSSKITFQEGDMVFEYPLLKLTTDSLIFRNPYVPRYLIEQFTHASPDSTIEAIKQNGVIVKLVKVNNGR